MTMYTGLARVAKKTGYPVVERPGWKTRGHGQMGEIKSIICHHTASADNGNAPALGYIEANRGALPGPLAHYVLGRDGTIYVVAAGLCWHAGKVGNAAHGNLHAIGIEAENDGRGEKWEAAQYDSYVKLCRALRDEFKLSTNDILGHKEIAVPRGRKIDPTFDMGAFRSYVAKGQYLDGKPGIDLEPAAVVKPVKRPAKPAASAPKQPDDYKDLVVDGDFGSVTVKAVQILMRAIGKYRRAVDGDWGKYTKAAVQEWLKGLGYYKRAVDGSFGKYSVTALQNFLRAKGLYPASKYVIDGDFGPATIKAWQAYLNQQNGK